MGEDLIKKNNDLSVIRRYLWEQESIVYKGVYYYRVKIRKHNIIDDTVDSYDVYMYNKKTKENYIVTGFDIKKRKFYFRSKLDNLLIEYEK